MTICVTGFWTAKYECISSYIPVPLMNKNRVCRVCPQGGARARRGTPLYTLSYGMEEKNTQGDMYVSALSPLATKGRATTANPSQTLRSRNTFRSSYPFLPYQEVVTHMRDVVRRKRQGLVSPCHYLARNCSPMFVEEILSICGLWPW